VVVVLVDLEMLGELVDTRGQRATWTSGEPVSLFPVAYSVMILVLSS
jgi:hypothetical protein